MAQYDLNHPTIHEWETVGGAPPPGDEDAPGWDPQEINDAVPDGADYKSVALEAYTLVFGDRQGDYGHPLDDFSRTSHYWTGHLMDRLRPGAVIVAEDVGPMMCLLKLSRQANKAKRDNMTDNCGYSETTERVIAERARRERRAATRRVRFEKIMNHFLEGRMTLNQVCKSLGLEELDASSV